MAQQRAYAAVRLTEGREWVDVGSIALLPELAWQEVARANGKVPTWAKVNPAVRVVAVDICEVAGN